ncbi:MAG: response regulator [candidate division Zixibacteria bacterium]
MVSQNIDNNSPEMDVPLIEGESTSASRPIKIMVVDDEKFVLDVLSEFLIDKGFDVLTAESGEEAVERFDSEKPDILIVDYKMDDMDGLATIEKISQISPRTVSIFMTGFPTLDTSIKALRLGAADYILKPFKLDEVALSVRKAISEWRLKEELHRLRDRVSKLEVSISERKDNIKINKKLGVIDGPHGYSTKFVGLTGNDSRS